MGSNKTPFKNLHQIFLRLGILLLLGQMLSQIAHGAEPIRPPDATKPHEHVVELNEEVEIRMGDTVALKGTDFSAKLVGFGTAGNPPEPVPEFSFRQGTFTCEPKSKLKAKREDRKCLSLLQHSVSNGPVRDRTAVKVRVIPRPHP